MNIVEILIVAAAREYRLRVGRVLRVNRDALTPAERKLAALALRVGSPTSP